MGKKLKTELSKTLTAHVSSFFKSSSPSPSPPQKKKKKKKKKRKENEKNIPKRGYCSRKQLISFETHKWNNFGWKFPAQNGKVEDTKQPV